MGTYGLIIINADIAAIKASNDLASAQPIAATATTTLATAFTTFNSNKDITSADALVTTAIAYFDAWADVAKYATIRATNIVKSAVTHKKLNPNYRISSSDIITINTDLNTIASIATSIIAHKVDITREKSIYDVAKTTGDIDFVIYKAKSIYDMTLLSNVKTIATNTVTKLNNIVAIGFYSPML